MGNALSRAGMVCAMWLSIAAPWAHAEAIYHVFELETLGSYSLATGTIDTSNLDPGDYVLRLVPAANIGVLSSGIDLNSPAIGSVSEPAGSVSEPVTIEFTIGEE